MERFKGPTREPITNKTNRRTFFIKAIPFIAGGIAGAITGELTNGESETRQAIGYHQERLDIHEKNIIAQKIVLLRHEKMLSLKQDKL